MKDSHGVYYSYGTDVAALEEENRLLRESMQTLERELEKFKRNPLLVCEVKDIIEGKALVRLSNGSEFFVDIAPDCEPLKQGDSALAEQKSLTLVRKITAAQKFDVSKFVIVEKPHVSWKQIGGLHDQVREITEVIELPLKKPKLFKKVGIEPPKGILLHGPPGTGKTILAKAVAHSTNSTFIQVVGSELVQKFIGEGAKLVKEMFELARKKAPSIIFIDEMDAICAKRIELGTSGEREVQRTFMQLLAEIDGFKPLDNVKIIGCTNRKDILDEAVLRPGRLDRMILVPLPDENSRKEIFSIHAKKVSLDNVNKETIIKKTEGLSGAEIKSVVTEAGYGAIRESRHKISERDLLEAIDKVRSKHEQGVEEIAMFG